MIYFDATRRCFLYDCPLHKDDPEVDIPLQRSNTRNLSFKVLIFYRYNNYRHY